MKRFIISILLFTLIVAVVGVISDRLITMSLRKSNYADYKDWNDIFTSNIKADLIIQGSSRAWLHVSPFILDSLLHLNSYNIGIDGYRFFMQYWRFKIYYRFNTKPKYIIQILDLNSMEKSPNLYNYQQFLPYVSDDVIKMATEKYKGLTWMDYRIPFYRYRGRYQNIIIGFLELLGIIKVKSVKYKGFQARQTVWDGSFEKFKENHPKGVVQNMDSISFHIFEAFLSNCIQDTIKVFLVYAPEYYEAQPLFNNRSEIISKYECIAKKYHVPFFDFSNDSISFEKENFYNSQHLNKKGAEQFTSKLAYLIRPFL